MRKYKELLSYDVSESGKILISFPDRKVGVFDENMVFLFELSFHSSGSYGAIWNGENILLVDVRYPAAVECGMDGRAAGSYAVLDDCYSKAVMIRLRKCGNTKISITNLPCSKPAPLPYIPQWWMDEFMTQKLDVFPMDMELGTMGAGQL